MACMLYIRQNRQERWLGRFRNRQTAEEYYRQWRKANAGKGIEPVYVETGKGRGKR